jgi:hypothetical protein
LYVRVAYGGVGLIADCQFLIADWDWLGGSIDSTLGDSGFGFFGNSQDSYLQPAVP